MKNKTMKKLLALGIASMMAISMIGCGNSGNSVATATDNSAEETDASNTENSAKETDTSTTDKVSSDIKVALILPGTANDKGWNQEAYDGLVEIGNLGYETAYSENVAASDYESTFRGYADQGYQIVIGHGTEFEDAACKVAVDYPDTMFCVTSSDIKQEPNVCSLQNLNNEQGFIAGVVAALATETGKVAAIGGMEIPSIQSYMVGFEQGVAYVDNGTEVFTAYTGDFSDATKVKEQATAFIEKGADIIAQDADEAGLGLFEAVKDTPDGIYAIGSIKDQYEECPEKVLTSATNAISKGMVVAVEMYAESGLEPVCYKFGVKEGVIGLADYHDCADVLTDEEKAFVEDVITKITNGEIEIESAQK